MSHFILVTLLSVIPMSIAHFLVLYTLNRFGTGFGFGVIWKDLLTIVAIAAFAAIVWSAADITADCWRDALGIEARRYPSLSWYRITPRQAVALLPCLVAAVAHFVAVRAAFRKRMFWQEAGLTVALCSTTYGWMRMAVEAILS